MGSPRAGSQLQQIPLFFQPPLPQPSPLKTKALSSLCHLQLFSLFFWFVMGVKSSFGLSCDSPDSSCPELAPSSQPSREPIIEMLTDTLRGASSQIQLLALSREPEKQPSFLSAGEEPVPSTGIGAEEEKSSFRVRNWQ